MTPGNWLRERLWMLPVIHLIVAGMFLVFGIVFALGKGKGLIAGYNTSSSEQKQEIEEKKLCKAMSRFMFVLALCWLVAASDALFHTKILLWIGPAMFLIAVIAGVVYMNTGNRFKK